MSSPVPIFGTQNVNDDDGPVIDSFLIETDAPPKPILEPIPVPPEITHTRETRLISGTVTLSVTSNSQLLLNGDKNRIAFRIYPYWTAAGTPAPTITDYINLGDDLGAVSNAAINGSTQGVVRLRPIATVGASPYEFNGHTGPIYISPAITLAQPIEVSWIAITL